MDGLANNNNVQSKAGMLENQCRIHDCAFQTFKASESILWQVFCQCKVGLREYSSPRAGSLWRKGGT